MHKSESPLIKAFNIKIDGGEEPYNLVEMKMMELSSAIRSKPNWHEKVKDEKIRSKWRSEAIAQSRMNNKEIDYVFDELKYYANIRTKDYELSSVDKVWQSDSLISPSLKKQFLDNFNILETDCLKNPDWHPDSNNQVLDLVHPSLFCLVVPNTGVEDRYRNRDTNNSGKDIGNYIRRITQTQITDKYNYQWLPAEFKIDSFGNVTIESYINNLHPIRYSGLSTASEHSSGLSTAVDLRSGLYGSIAMIFSKFVPMLEMTLQYSLQKRRERAIYNAYDLYDCTLEDIKLNKKFNCGNGEYENDELDDEEERHEEWLKIRKIKLPKIPNFNEQIASMETVEHIKLRDRNLQVIVKLANIILTPENPKYPGGSWHIEGTKLENICASAIYYFSSDNISESSLAFRQAICDPIYEQNDNQCMKEVYGLEHGDEMNQMLGYVITKQDRCITFPNYYQHRVLPFELKDPNKPGFRKILVFFVVDPYLRITSTTDIAPQQSWIDDEIYSVLGFTHAQILKSICEIIARYVYSPMSLKTALANRLQLMKERKYFTNTHTREIFEREFSLCEH